MLYLKTSRGKKYNKSHFEDLDQHHDKQFNKIYDDYLEQHPHKEFNMDSVEKRINHLTNNIKERISSSFNKITAGIVSELIVQEFNTNAIQDIYDNFKDLETILNRLKTNNLLTPQVYDDIIVMIKDKKLESNLHLSYVLDNLITEYKTQKEADNKLKSFVLICNNYFTDKKYVYDEINVRLYLNKHKKDSTANMETPDEQDEIKITDLSSGEKQIVSLFSELYLNDQSDLSFLFDEPELSLSIKWQEKLLPDIIQSGKCKFMFIVTHSPFIAEHSALKKELLYLTDDVIGE